MRINGFRCDACCKEHLIASMIMMRDVVEEFPSDWFILYQGKAGQGKEPLTFCSTKCMGDWAEKQIAEKQYAEKVLLEQQLIAMGERHVVSDSSEKTHWENW